MVVKRTEWNDEVSMEIFKVCGEQIRLDEFEIDVQRSFDDLFKEKHTPQEAVKCVVQTLFLSHVPSVSHYLVNQRFTCTN